MGKQTLKQEQLDRRIEECFKIVQRDADNPEKESIALELFLQLCIYNLGHLEDAVFTHEVQATNEATFDSYTMRFERKGE
ncbi:hypothetical protein [Furfurilactobacillus entadae]|uniref:hypothetical protein n=1 Tax=Furfurilactobacillus entadae TaxID=2922307 RepID=UPI0035E8F140